MIKSDIKAIERYWHATTRLGQFINDDIKIHATKKLLHDLSENVENVDVYKRWLKTACDHKDGNELEYVLAIGYALQLFNENTIEVLKPYVLDNWYYSMEEMVALIEKFGGTNRVELLGKMAIQKYPGHDLGENDEYVTRKSMWALHRLYENGDIDALEEIKKLSSCGDDMVEGFANHHLQKLNLKI